MSTAVDPDQALVTAAVAGDLAAFETLVERHGDAVYRIAARIVGRDEAEDVAQEAFLRAYHRLPRFKGSGTFRSWLLSIAHNSAVDALQRRRAEDAEPIDGRPESASGEERTPVAQLESRERRDRLELKMKVLKPEHRAVLVLRDVEGLTYAEIAEVTETPLGSVKGRLHRARGELIDLLRTNAYDWDLPE